MIATRQLTFSLAPVRLLGEWAPGVTRGDWREQIAVAMPHPSGGYTVALPAKPGTTSREYRGRYHTFEAARDAASSTNK